MMAGYGVIRIAPGSVARDNDPMEALMLIVAGEYFYHLAMVTVAIGVITFMLAWATEARSTQVDRPGTGAQRPKRAHRP